ncbi:MAG: T9SS type A sorting domain-containing protein [Bacteroidales bacterium]|nr:T9SS type A sorting domain-containing protein [Bacteroidales bacterium]
MKNYYYFIFCFLLLGSQNTFSQNIIGNEDSKSSSKTIVELMALDSLKYYFAPTEPTIFEYDNSGNLILIKDDFSKTINTYNMDNLLISSLFHIWDYDSNYLRPHELMVYTYDNNNKVIEFTLSINIDNLWLQNTKTNYEYSNNLKTKEIFHFFNEDSNSWVLSASVDYIYNSNNLLTNINSYYYNDDGQAYLGSQTSNTYDNNNMTYSLYESFDTESVLVYGTKSYMTYNSSNLLIEQWMESYSIYNDSIWIPYNKSEMTYYNNDLMESQNNYLYGNEDWNLHRIDSFSYDNYNNQVFVESYGVYNEVWTSVQKLINVLDYNYTSDDILHHMPDPINNSQMYIPNYSHMLTKTINGYYNTNNWSFDTTQYFYSSKSFQISLPENILYNGNDFRVYPNPASDITIINLIGLVGDIDIRIIDINGREIKRVIEKSNGSMDIGIDVSSFNKGVYFINIRNGKFAQTKKLIVN